MRHVFTLSGGRRFHRKGGRPQFPLLFALPQGWTVTTAGTRTTVHGAARQIHDPYNSFPKGRRKKGIREEGKKGRRKEGKKGRREEGKEGRREGGKKGRREGRREEEEEEEEGEEEEKKKKKRRREEEKKRRREEEKKRSNQSTKYISANQLSAQHE
jgi:hypothetical protein